MEDTESLVSHNEKVKQAKDTLKSHLGTKILDEFVTHTEECKKAVTDGDTALQKDVKDNAFDQWVSHSMADNANHKKFGSPQSGLSSQCGLSNHQCAKTIESVTDASNNHNWDSGWKEKKQKKKKKTSLS